MNRPPAGWASLLLAVAALSCDGSANTEAPLREGGTGDAPAADSGFGGEDGDDDYRPDLVPPPRRTPEPPPAAGSDAPDAGNPPSSGAGARSIAGAGAGGASGNGGSGAAGNDAGAPPDPEDDAGADPPDPPDPPPCTTVGCLCDTICQRGVALGCEEEPPIEYCLELCNEPAPECASEQLTMLRCQAELPDEGYVCDDFLLAFAPVGCEEQQAAYSSCRQP